MAGLLGLAYMDKLLDNLTLKTVIVLGVAAIAAYIFVIVVYSIIAHKFYQKKHMKARKRVKQYSHNLLVLSKMYEKEKA